MRSICSGFTLGSALLLVMAAPLTAQEKTGSNRAAMVDGPGYWVSEGNELVKAGGKQGWIWFGDPTWTDYEFSFTIVKTSGPGGISVLFRAPRPRVGYLFTLGAPNGDTRLEFQSPDGKWWYPHQNPSLGLPRLTNNGPLTTGRPCHIRVEVRGSTCRCWRDNELMFTYNKLELASGMVGLRDHGQSSLRVSDIVVKSLDGKVLWSGVPNFPRRDTPAGPAASPNGPNPPRRDTLAGPGRRPNGPLAPTGRATVVVQLGHSGLVSAVAFSPNGQQVLTGSHDETARLWDMASGRLILTFQGHTSYIDSAVFSPNGKLILTGGQDKTARVWDVSSGKEIRAFNGHAGRVFSVAFSPDGKQVLTGSVDNTARLWDVTTGTEIRTFAGHTGGIHSVAFSPDGTKVLTAGADRTARLWDVATGKEIRAVQGGNGVVAVFSPDGKKVCKGSRLFDAASGEEILALHRDNDIAGRDTRFGPEGSGPQVPALKRDIRPPARGQRAGPAAKVPQTPALKRDLRTPARGPRAGPAAKVPQTPALKRDIRTPARGSRAGPAAKVPQIQAVPRDIGARAAAFSPDGMQLVTASGPEALLWDATTGKQIASFQGHSGAVLTVAFSPDGKQVLTGGADKVARLFATTSDNESRTFQGIADVVLSVAFSSDGKQVLAGRADQKARLWDVAGAKRTGAFQGGTAVAFSPDGKQVLTVSADNTARLWDVVSGKEIRSFLGHNREITSAAFSRDGKRVLTASADRTARLWDVTTGMEIARFPGDQGTLHSVAFSPDGKQVLIGGGLPGIESVARLWDVASGEMKSIFRGHTYPIKSVAFSPDGRRVLTGSWDETARLWDADSGKQIRTFGMPTLGLRNMVWSVAFSPDGKQVLAGSSEHTVRLWDADSGAIIRDFQGHTALVESVAFSPDGKKVLTGSRDGTARLWDTASGLHLCTFIDLRDDTWTAVSPENYYMASRRALDGVAFRIGNRSFPFDQFDLKFNRPDKVIERIGLAPPELVATYRQAYQKRLKRMNFTEAMLSDDFHLPEVTVNSDVLSSTGEKALKLKVRARDSKYRLDRIHVDVNGVPTHGTNGIDLRKSPSMNWEQEIEVELSPGRNRVDVSVLNEKGAESLKETLSVQCNAPARKPDLYVVAVGVSDYQDARFPPLKYADKDANDIVDLFQSKRDHFGVVKVNRILNRDATREIIQGARDFLSDSQVDDLVVVFFAGHGLLHNKRDYYFATADIDSDAPAKRGLPFEALEDLLDGIRPRKKLLLVDTCYSGELDTDDVPEVGLEKKPADGVKKRTDRGLYRPSPRVGPSDSHPLLQEMFADLRRGTGAVVIASAGGSEAAAEGPTWNNGVFTHAVLRGLKGEADRDRDGRVLVSELRDFVEIEVPRLTAGRQSPTARRENLVVDFTFD